MVSILHGVGREYDSIAGVITSQRENMSLQEASYLLMIHEQRMAQFDSVGQLDVSQASANFTSSGNQYDKRNQRGGYNIYNGGRNNGNRSRGRGRNNGRWNNSNRPTCQMCGKIGHVSISCYHRFDQNFQGNNQANIYQSSQPQSNYNSGQHPPNFTNSHHQANLHQSTAYYAMPETVWDSARYADSGATNHVTSDLANLSIHSEYQGPDRLAVGNGQQLQISHTGKTVLSSIGLSSKILHLNHMLCVPKIAKNLLSISRITKDNNAYAEFNCDSCFIKDKSTKETLLQGRLENGLYKLFLEETPKRTDELSSVKNNSRVTFSISKNKTTSLPCTYNVNAGNCNRSLLNENMWH